MKRKGISLISGFSPKMDGPLDDRSTVALVSDLDLIPNKYEGMRVSCLENKKNYYYYDGEFTSKGNGDSGLGNDIKTEEDYLIR